MIKWFLILNVFVVFTICSALSRRAHADFITEMGNYTQVIVPAYALGMAMNEDGWDGAKQFAFAFTSMEIALGGTKAIVREKRPDGSDRKSFPSGHTAAAFSGATFIHRRYGFKQAIIPYILAAFTGYSRIHAEKHWVHDCVAGAALSALTTWMFVGRYNVAVTASPDEVKLNYNVKF